MLLQGVLGKDGLYRFTSFPLQHLSSRHSFPAATSSTPTTCISFSSGALPHCNLSGFNKSHVIPSSSVSRSAYHAVVDNKVPTVFELWHYRLGHASKQVVSNILHLCKIPFTNKMCVDTCKACCLGKVYILKTKSEPFSAFIQFKTTSTWFSY